jgi:hypothetical protein
MRANCAWWSWLAIAALGVAVALAGCGGAGSGSGGHGGGSPAGTGGQAGTTATGTGGQAGTGQSGAGGGQAGAGGLGGAGGQAPTSYAITFGPLQVGPGVEDTQCVVVRLGNSAAIHVGQVHNQAGPAAVQMILYTSTDTTEQPTPFRCTPFVGVYTQSGMTPLTISQNSDETLTFPAGVGIPLAANQMMRIELHFVNASTTDSVSIQATSTLTTIPDGSFQSAAAFLAVEDIDVSLSPGAAQTMLGPVFVPFPANVTGAKFFAATGEEHKWGTSAQLFSAASSFDPGTSIYLDTTWNTPPLTPLQPALTAAAGAGFNLLCTWHSLSPSFVTYGQASTDEICLFVAYYYPSQGPQVCVHTDKTGTGIDVFCCPGDSTCASLTN